MERDLNTICKTLRYFYYNGDFWVFYTVRIFLHSDLQTKNLVLILFVAEFKEIEYL